MPISEAFVKTNGHNACKILTTCRMHFKKLAAIFIIIMTILTLLVRLGTSNIDSASWELLWHRVKNYMGHCHYSYRVELLFSKYVPWTSSSNVTWELVRNVAPQAPVQTYGNSGWGPTIHVLTSPWGWLWCMLKFESHLDVADNWYGQAESGSPMFMLGPQWWLKILKLGVNV